MVISTYSLPKSFAVDNNIFFIINEIIINKSAYIISLHYKNLPNYIFIGI